MGNTYGHNIKLTLFGESHGEAIGAVIDGLKAGIEVDREFIKSQLSKRRPAGKISTARQETDEFSILSGVFNGKTTGTPVTIVIQNKDTKSKDYGDIMYLPRPSHADYTGYVKYDGFNDYRGGGHFSGRVTAAIVAAGAIVISYLEKMGIKIFTHISKCAGVQDRDFNDFDKDYDILKGLDFPVLDEDKAKEMREKIESVASDGDSVGGILQTAVTGLPAGIGEPWFDTFEGVLAKGLFSIPAVKGVSFGLGFGFADATGSAVNDAFYMDNGEIKTKTNNNGGINGGITNSMPVIINTCVKPTPSIYKEQETVNMKTKENTTLTIQGRHDPAIIHRAAVVVDSITAFATADMLSQK